MRVMMALTLASTLLAGVASLAAADTWKNVSLVDVSCHTKVKDHPDAHTRACAIQCATAGYGIITADGLFLTFDKTGNEKALALLKASQQADHVRVTVTGTRKGDEISVTSIAMQ